MTDSKKPLISVIIPTYNRSALVTKAITSVIDQTYKKVEIIVVDDGSTDKTSEIIQNFSHQYSHLIYIHKPNGGCASARNKGLENARGDYLTFLDSDDQWEPYAVEMMVSALVSSSSDLVYSPSIEVFSDGRQEINRPVSAGNPENLATAHFMNTNVRNGSFMFSRTALKKVGFLDEALRFNEDSDFFQRLAINSRAIYIPNPTVRVLNHSGGKSRNRIEVYKALLKSLEKILVQYPDFAKKLGQAAETRKVELSIDLIEELILEEKWSEAISLQEKLQGKLGHEYKLSTLLKRRFPTQMAIFFRKVRKKISHSLSLLSSQTILWGKNNG
jgi:glycosyltransferase involved in cell wall biosynthesis